MNLETLLDQPHLSVLAPPADADLACIHDTIAHKAVVSGRDELEDLLGRLLALGKRDVAPKTLDLIAHAKAGSGLLELGSWTLDASNPVVASYFRELADQNVLPRLGVHSVRLLGSLSGDTAVGQWTICALADILGLEVYGTKNLVFARHFGASGFLDANARMFVRSSDLRSTREMPSTQPLLVGDTVPRALDVDALPRASLPELSATRGPRRFASADDAAALLRLVRRTAACAMPGLLLAPHCEVLLPSTAPGTYHAVHVMLDGAYLKIFVDGPTRPAMYYAVTKPRELFALVEAMPQAAAG